MDIIKNLWLVEINKIRKGKKYEYEGCYEGLERGVLFTHTCMCTRQVRYWQIGIAKPIF